MRDHYEFGIGGAYACTTTETSHRPGVNYHHHPTMTITEGAATATAEATIDNGVITAVGNIQHGSGTFTGTNIAYTWKAYNFAFGVPQGEPQRGSGATFTFSVSGGQVTGVTVTNGGTGYRKPCNAGESYNPPSYYVDETAPSYYETSRMRAALRRQGTEPLLVRFAIIRP